MPPTGDCMPMCMCGMCMPLPVPMCGMCGVPVCGVPVSVLRAVAVAGAGICIGESVGFVGFVLGYVGYVGSGTTSPIGISGLGSGVRVGVQAPGAVGTPGTPDPKTFTDFAPRRSSLPDTALLLLLLEVGLGVPRVGLGLGVLGAALREDMGVKGREGVKGVPCVTVRGAPPAVLGRCNVTSEPPPVPPVPF
jgi:hypothetical protein